MGQGKVAQIRYEAECQLLSESPSVWDYLRMGAYYGMVGTVIWFVGEFGTSIFTAPFDLSWANFTSLLLGVEMLAAVMVAKAAFEKRYFALALAAGIVGFVVMTLTVAVGMNQPQVVDAVVQTWTVFVPILTVLVIVAVFGKVASKAVQRRRYEQWAKADRNEIWLGLFERELRVVHYLTPRQSEQATGQAAAILNADSGTRADDVLGTAADHAARVVEGDARLAGRKNLAAMTVAALVAICTLALVVVIGLETGKTGNVVLVGSAGIVLVVAAVVVFGNVRKYRARLVGDVTGRHEVRR